MGFRELKEGVAYKPVRNYGEGELYAYVRGWKGERVGFSILEENVSEPDFSNCGTFWVRPEDFMTLFEEHGRS